MKKSKVIVRLALAATAVTLCLGNAPVRASESDDKVEAAFKNSYVAKTYLTDDAIQAKCKDGVVTLSGTVEAESHKFLAAETAASQNGVSRVDNKLETKAEAAADNADLWIGRKVKMTLLFHRHVNAHKTSIAVKDCVVTLTGEASSLAQKELTTEYALDIEGVKLLKNDMTVAATPEPAEQMAGAKMDDASISAQVKTALWTHRSTSSVKTKVETRDGAVTLTGIAKNDAEKALVSKLVNDIQGVTSVHNEMTVEVIKI